MEGYNERHTSRFFDTYINCSFVIYSVEVDSGYGLIFLFSFLRNLPLKRAFFCDMKTLACQHLVQCQPLAEPAGPVWGEGAWQTGSFLTLHGLGIFLFPHE